MLKNNEIHTWDRGYDDDGNQVSSMAIQFLYPKTIGPQRNNLFPSQVWGVKVGPYEFKPAPTSSFNDMYTLNFSPSQAIDKAIEGSFVLQE